tara:strand:+ start:145 stop:1059 length:915 start_codon:yes stop_codon:yes gene_type:complete
MNKQHSYQPLVSIIMNCFNGERYLRDSIDSVISQTYENWEVIFWDNRSNDNSAKIFKDYKDDRLKYYCADSHTEILYRARNYALKKTKGEFIAFLDVDDWWLPEKLEKQIPLFNDPEVGMVYGNVWLFHEKKNKKELYKKGKLPTGKILNELLNDYVIGSPTYVIRKKTLESLDYSFNDDFHIIGDFDINIRLSAKWKINCTQSPIAFARRHSKNESIFNREKEIYELKVWFKQMKDNQLISSQSNFKKVELMASYLETMQSILKNGFTKSFLMVRKYPFSFNKIKLILALFLPNLLLRKIKNY